MHELETTNDQLNEEFQGDTRSYDADQGHVSSLLDLLANVRKLYQELENEAAIPKRANTSLIDHVRSNETVGARSYDFERSSTWVFFNHK